MLTNYEIGNKVVLRTKTVLAAVLRLLQNKKLRFAKLTNKYNEDMKNPDKSR